MAAIKTDDALQEQVKQLLAAASKKVVSQSLSCTLQRSFWIVFGGCCRSRSGSCWQPPLRRCGDDFHPAAAALDGVWVVLQVLCLVHRGRACLFHQELLSQPHSEMQQQMLQKQWLQSRCCGAGGMPLYTKEDDVIWILPT